MDIDHLQFGGDEVEDLGHVFAHQPQYAAAVGAALAGIEHNGLARRVLRDARLAAAPGRDALFQRRGIGGLVLDLLWRLGSRIGGGARRLEVFEGKLQLLDLALDLLRTRAVLLLLQPGDGDL